MFELDICSFINSHDIAVHCRSINYQFTPLEAAYLIWRSRRRTAEDKQIAWNELIEANPDMTCDLDIRNMCPIIPTPFKKGDIVKFYMPDTKVQAKNYYDKEVYVLDCIAADNPKGLAKQHDYLWHDAQDKERRIDDVILYQVDEHGYIVHRCEPFFLTDDDNINYLDMEYYHGELHGNQEILKAISSYLKGDIELSLLMNAHYAMTVEENARKLTSGFYIDKYCGAYDLPLNLVGLSYKEMDGWKRYYQR